MQNFTIVKPGEIVADSLLKINNSIESVASNFSGKVFPTNNLFLGMSCYREDLGKKYTLKSINPLKWEADNSYADQAANADNAAMVSKYGIGIQKNGPAGVNELVNTGFYYCTGSGLPSGIVDANVYHHAFNNEYAHQLAFGFGPNYNNTIYSRIKNNNKWSSWRQIATTDTVLPLTGGTLTGQLTVPTIYTPDWFRTTGDTGWYNQKWGGGWHMSDATWIRAYNGKNVYTTGVFQADGGFNGPLHGTADNSNKLIGKTWNWSGQSGQPTWLWGGSDGTNMYVYNPVNFNVNSVGGYTADALRNRTSGRTTPVMTPIMVHDNWETHTDSGMSGKGNGNITLTKDYRNFDKILIIGSDNSCNTPMSAIWEKWELEFMFNNTWRFNLYKDYCLEWWIYSSVNKGTTTHSLSTGTFWYVQQENAAVIEIYGLNY